MDEPTLSAPQRIALLFAIGISICMGGFFFAVKNKPKPVTVPAPTSVVKVVMKDGHGSGVSIGNGYILTAAHVAKEGVLKVKNSMGVEQDAEVLWLNEFYDVALLKVSKPELIGVSTLSCRAPDLSEEIIAEGSPLRTEFTRFWGHANGSPQKFGPWSEVFSMDMTVLPGISGGPVFDKSGKVVGIAVGVAMLPLGMSNSVTGIGYGVAGSTICKLLART